MPGNEVLTPLEQRRAHIEQTRENSARLARAYATHRTTGWGEILVDTPVQFGCTFLKPPAVTSGMVLISSQTGNEAEPVTNRFPRVNAGVWKWQQDVHDYYTGAYLFFVVETVGFQMTGGYFPYTSSDPGYVIDHHLLFEGVSYKDFNVALLDY